LEEMMMTNQSGKNKRYNQTARRNNKQDYKDFKIFDTFIEPFWSIGRQSPYKQ
jgi:hypothetical protein